MNISFIITKADLEQAAHGQPHFLQRSVCPAECSSVDKSSFRCFKNHLSIRGKKKKREMMKIPKKLVSPQAYLLIEDLKKKKRIYRVS